MIDLLIEKGFRDEARLEVIRGRLASYVPERPDLGAQPTSLRLDGEGVSLLSDGQVLRGDFTRMIPRLHPHKLARELLVRAAKIKGVEGPFKAMDATAGLGEDALLLAAAGFEVKLYERNPVIFTLLEDAIIRASQIPQLQDAIGRMEAFYGDSLEAMKALEVSPDVILLDPMFPQRQKSALVKKKLQVIQDLEAPCQDEAHFLKTAMEANPQKLIVKRPPKGPHLAGIKPDYCLQGKAVRYDCFSWPQRRIESFGWDHEVQ